MVKQDEVGRLCIQVGEFLRRAHMLDAAGWYEARGESLLQGVSTDQRAVIADIHDSISAGSGGPLGVIIVDENGRADVEATTRYKQALNQLYNLTTQSRFRDWLKSITG